MFVVWPSSVYEREHVTHGVLAGNTIVKMAGSGPGEGHHGDPLAREEGPWAIHGVT
jgi:hypothetical protein